MPFLALPYSLKHVGADSRVVDVCAYWHVAEKPHDMESECIAHGVYVVVNVNDSASRKRNCADR